MSRHLRVRPRFYLVLAVAAAGLTYVGWTVLGHGPRVSHRPPSSRRGSGPVVPPRAQYTKVEGTFQRAPSQLPLPLNDFAAVAQPGAEAIIGGYTRGGRINPLIYDLTGHGVVAEARMSRPHANGGAVKLGSEVLYVGGSHRPGMLSARIQPVEWIAANRSAPGKYRSLSRPLAAMATAVGGGAAFAVGGRLPQGASNLIYRWHATGSPRLWAHLPRALIHPAAAVFHGTLWVVGGFTPQLGYADAIYAVNLRSGRATRVATLPVPTAHAAVAQFNGRLWILGGKTPQGPTRHTWVIQGPHTIASGPRLPMAVAGANAFVLDHRLWVGGGQGASGQPLQRLWWYVPPAPRPHRSRSSAPPARRAQTGYSS